MNSPNRKFLPAIDHLRAFAALLIFYYHSYWLTYQQITPHAPGTNARFVTGNPALAGILEGHTAVGLFLVISGFILTWGTLGSPLKPLLFFRNRALRILPMLLLMILLGYYTVKKIDLMGTLQMLSPLGGGLELTVWTATVWSLAVEQQLYLIFPFVHGQLRANSFRLLLLAVALTYGIRFAGLGLGADVKDVTYWSTLGHVEQFLCGAGAAWWLHQRKDERGLSGYWAPVCGLGIAGVLFGFHRLGGFEITQWWRVFFPTVEAVMWSVFLLAYLDFSKWVPGPVSKALMFVGKISYSLYLIHMAVITIYVNHRWYFPSSAWPSAGILLSATAVYLPPALIGAWLTYTLVEKPFLNLRLRYLA